MITSVQYCDSDGSYCINRMHDTTADTTYIRTVDDTSTLMDGPVVYVIRPYLKHYTTSRPIQHTHVQLMIRLHLWMDE